MQWHRRKILGRGGEDGNTSKIYSVCGHAYRSVKGSLFKLCHRKFYVDTPDHSIVDDPHLTKVQLRGKVKAFPVNFRKLFCL